MTYRLKIESRQRKEEAYRIEAVRQGGISLISSATLPEQGMAEGRAGGVEFKLKLFRSDAAIEKWQYSRVVGGENVQREQGPDCRRLLCETVGAAKSNAGRLQLRSAAGLQWASSLLKNPFQLIWSNAGAPGNYLYSRELDVCFRSSAWLKPSQTRVWCGMVWFVRKGWQYPARAIAPGKIVEQGKLWRARLLNNVSG